MSAGIVPTKVVLAQTGLSRHMLDLVVENGLLHPVMIGQRRFYKQSEVDRFLEVPSVEERSMEAAQ